MIEPLETRIAPATLDVVSGVLTYSGTGSIENALTLSVSGTNYTFNDTGELITLGGGAVAAGFTGNNSNNVSGPDANVSSILIQLGLGNDTFTVTGLNDPLAVTDAGGADEVIVSAAGSNANGNVLLQAETIDLNSLSGVAILTLTADTLSVDGAVGVTGSVTIAPLTGGRTINLGTENAAHLSLVTGELSQFSAPTKIVIGSSSAGSILSNAAFSFTNTSVLSLQTGGGITQSGAGAISVASLAIDADSNVTFNGANDVDTLAANVSDTGADFALTDADGFQLGVVDGITGLTTTGAGSIVTLSAGAVTQAAGAKLTADQLLLAGAGPFTLTDTTNNVSALAANVTGNLSFTDATGFDVTTVGAVNGITVTDSTVALVARGGDIHVLNADGAATADIDAGAGRVLLTAGAAGSDFAIVIDANAGLVATNSAGGSAVTFTADHMTIGAAINAGTENVAFRPFESTTAINLGGADGAAQLGLTAAELNFVTGTSLAINQQFSNPLTISVALTPANVDRLSLAGANIGGAGSITVETLSIFTQTPVTLNGANDVDFLFLSGTPGPGVSFSDADGFSLSGDLLTKGDSLVTLNAGTAAVTFQSNFTFVPSFSSPAPSTGHDQIAVVGTVTLEDAVLSPFVNTTLPQATEFVILDNDGTADPIIGTFKNLPEGAALTTFQPSAFITYTGGDGNDVAIVTRSPLVVDVAPDKKSATYRDVDGDLVTVKTSVGEFDGSEFFGIEIGANGAGQLQRLVLDADFTGTKLTVTAKPSPDGGNAFVNIGVMDASGVDLGAVSIAGDLGSIQAGATGGDAKVPAVKSLTVESLALFGLSTQVQGTQFIPASFLDGTLAKLTVKGDFRGFLSIDNGRLGSATIGGSVVSFDPNEGAFITAEAGIDSLKIGGDIRGVAFIGSDAGAIGTMTVGGSIAGGFVGIDVFGRATAPAKGTDLALKALKVGGSVEHLTITAGEGNSDPNADASIGSITVGGDWIASTITAGAETGNDGAFGTADDAKFSGGATRDNPAIFSTIGSFTVKGQALGTAGTTTDMFGIVAERIGKAKVGGRTFAFKTGTNEAFFAAPTLDGAGTENPMFDFTIRELGSTTPTVALGGANLVVNGNTATFTDVDGDLVTVKRSEGTFVAGDFAITTTASGGGQFTKLTLTTAPGNLTITAKPGPQGGNGLVNIGGIEAIGVTVGNVAIAGDLGQFEGGLSADGKPGTAALTAHSIGALGQSTGATSDFSKFTGGLGKLTVTGDVRDVDLESFIAGEKWGAVSIAGALIGSTLAGEDGIGSVKIGGSFRQSQISGEGPLGAITIGGDLVGDVADGFSIFSFGQLTSPTAGLDVAIKSITVKGSVENARVIVGTGFDVNRDASIGAISVGRSWLASSVLVGANVGPDTFAGTSDDTQAIPAGGGDVRDVSTRFSTIASIAIKGQALGSAATGDSFGIVAEQIGKAKIGTLTFKFTKGARNLTDAFAAAPTGPGPAPDNAAFDFFIREITA